MKRTTPKDLSGAEEGSSRKRKRHQQQQQQQPWGGGATAAVVDIVKMHEEKMDAFHTEIEVKVPEMRAQLEAFRKVLADQGEMTDAMANAVFKDHNLLRNARQQEKRRRKIANAEFDKKTLAKFAEDGAISEEGYNRVQTLAKEHINRLRRLKGKQGSKLSLAERHEIQAYIRRKEIWLQQAESQAEYIEYVCKAIPLIERYTREVKQVEKYMEAQNQETQEQAIREAQRQQLPGTAAATQAQLQQDSPKISLLLLEPVDGDNALVPRGEEEDQHTTALEPSYQAQGTLACWVPQSDIYMKLTEIQAEYFAFVGEDDPFGYAQLQIQTTAQAAGKCKACNVDMFIDAQRAEQTCPKCAIAERWSDVSMRVVPYNVAINPPKSKASYERKTYKDKWLKQVSGELNGMVSEDDWAIIFKDCAEMGWETVDKVMVKRILKRRGMSDYYDLVPVITNELNGVPLIKFSPEERAALDIMFDEAMILFDRCPWEVKQRSNYISYEYHFYQCCRMLGYDQYLDAFSLLTGDDNKKQHDRIWKWMCENKTTEPKWIFTPTF